MNSQLLPYYLVSTVGVKAAIDIVSVSLRTINNTTRAVTNIMTQKPHKTNKDLKDFIQTVDLVFKLNVIREFILDINQTRSKSVLSAIEGVNEMLIEIENVTDKIQNNIEYNKSLYLKYFFKIDNTASINQLEMFVNKLLERFKMLCTVQQATKIRNSVESI